MKQAISGVSPAEVAETTVMTVWPSVAVYPLARWLGRCYAIRWPDLYIFRLGNAIALATIPLGVLLYFRRLAPQVYGFPLGGAAYQVTNQRVMELQTVVSHDKQRSPWGIGLGIAAGVVGFLVAWLITGWFELATFWQVAISLAIGAIGAVKWFLIGCADVKFFQVTRARGLDQFDAIDVEVEPGQEWYDAGNLVFRSGGVEKFRLVGVSRPEAFRQVCLKAHHACVGVQQSRGLQSA